MKLFILSLVFLVSQAQAEKINRVAILFGGGCDPKSTLQKNEQFSLFLPSIEKDTAVLKKRGWRTIPLYLTVASKEGLLGALDAEIATATTAKANHIPTQVYLSFNTHGRPYQGEKPHSICIAGPNGTFVEFPMTDPDLHHRLNALFDTGAKIGINDEGCYGGASIKLFHEYGCVLTTQSSNREFFSPDNSGNSLSRMGGREHFNLVDIWREDLNVGLRSGFLLTPQMSDLKEDGMSEVMSRILTEPTSLVTSWAGDITEADYGLDRVQTIPQDIDTLIGLIKASASPSEKLTEELADFRNSYLKVPELQAKQKEMEARLHETVIVDLTLLFPHTLSTYDLNSRLKTVKQYLLPNFDPKISDGRAIIPDHIEADYYAIDRAADALRKLQSLYNSKKSGAATMFWTENASQKKSTLKASNDFLNQIDSAKRAEITQLIKASEKNSDQYLELMETYSLPNENEHKKDPVWLRKAGIAHAFNEFRWNLYKAQRESDDLGECEKFEF